MGDFNIYKVGVRVESIASLSGAETFDGRFIPVSQIGSLLRVHSSKGSDKSLRSFNPIKSTT